MWKGKVDFSLFLSFFFFLTILKFMRFDYYNEGGFDLGNKFSILWNIKNKGIVWNSLNNCHGFAGHFQPIMYFFAIFLYIWENPKMLLILQNLIVVSGAFFLYKFSKNLYIVLLYCFHFLLHEVVHYDFHPEVLSIFLFLLGFYLYERKSNLFCLPFIFSLLLKEDLPFILLGISLYFLIEFFARKEKFILINSILIFSCSLTYSILLFSFWKPEVSIPLKTHYPQFGEGYVEFFSNLFKNPLKIAKILFKWNKILNFIKLLASFGFFIGKEFVLLIIPVFENLLSEYWRRWQFKVQYATYLLPLGIYMVYKTYEKVKDKKLAKYLFYFAFIINFIFLPNYFLMIKKRHSKLLDKVLKEYREKKNLVLCANQNIVPHLCARESIYQFPFGVNESDFIILDKQWGFYPFPEEFKDSILKEFSRKFKIVYKFDGIYIFENIRKRRRF